MFRVYKCFFVLWVFSVQSLRFIEFNLKRVQCWL